MSLKPTDLRRHAVYLTPMNRLCRLVPLVRVRTPPPPGVFTFEYIDGYRGPVGDGEQFELSHRNVGILREGVYR